MKKAILISSDKNYAEYPEEVMPAPPLNILALGSYLIAHGVPVELIDLQVDFGIGLTQTSSRIVHQRVARYLRDQAETIAWVGISQMASTQNGVPLAREIHAVLPDVPIVFGGYFPSRLYRRLLKEYPFVTAVVCGDGEISSLQISRCLAEGRSFPSKQIPNLAWLNEGEIQTNTAQPMCLDDLPILDFRLLRNLDWYPHLHLMTSRGCPSQCNFCLESIMRPYSTYSPAWVSDQLDNLEAALSKDKILIADPNFGIGRERTLEMCRVLHGRRFTYALESRVDVLLPDLIPILHDAGVKAIYWGMESASPATLVRMNKVGSLVSAERYLQKALEVLEACFKNDVTPIIGLMTGFPGDTEIDCQASLHFIGKIEALYSRITARTGVRTGFLIKANVTQVYEGSPLSEQMKSFDKVTLSPECPIGTKTVLSPSPGVGQDQLRDYQERLTHHAGITSIALERYSDYLLISMDALTAIHPDVVN